MMMRQSQISILLCILFNFPTLAGNKVSYARKPLFQQEQEHAHTLTPEQEKAYYQKAAQKGNEKLLDFRFRQTDWRECTDQITGNYSGYNCVNRRGISVILKRFIDDYMPGCVQEALDATTGGRLDQLHIIHDGVLGDRNHSPRSMHAENRAIDIDSFIVTTYDGQQKKFLYEDPSNRAFYTAFRTCWGKSAHDNNGCPYYQNNPLRTASIGWEDSNHQHHMHTSIPYCLGGDYGDYYYNR